MINNATIRFLSAILIVLSGCCQSTYGAGGESKAKHQTVEQNYIYPAGAGMVFNGDALYMTFASGSFKKRRGLYVIDVTTPETPKLLNETSLAHTPMGLAISGKTLYLVNGYDFIVLDVSNPSAPALIKTLPINADPLLGPRSVTVKGEYAYLACLKAGIVVVDISNPKSPVRLKNIKIPGIALQSAVSGNRLLVASDTMGISVISDIDNVGKTSFTTRCPIPDGTTRFIAVAGGRAYVAQGYHLIRIFDPSNSGNPRSLGNCAARGAFSFFGSFSYAVALRREAVGASKLFAYIADGESGVLRLDVTDPRHPRVVGALMAGMGMGGSYDVRAVKVKGEHIFCEDDNFGLRVLKIGRDGNLTLTGPGLPLKKGAE